jgi:plasmid stability protein
MRTAEVVDMSGARDNVLHMSKMIQIRNVPDELHRQLKMRAAATGMSMSDYIKRELSLRARRVTIGEIAAETRALPPSGVTTAKTVEIIREMRGD